MEIQLPLKGEVVRVSNVHLGPLEQHVVAPRYVCRYTIVEKPKALTPTTKLLLDIRTELGPKLVWGFHPLIHTPNPTYLVRSSKPFPSLVSLWLAIADHTFSGRHLRKRNVESGNLDNLTK